MYAKRRGAIGGLIGLIAASEKTGFDKLNPAHHEKFVSLNNWLLYVAAEHWLGYILACAFLSAIWALIVVEPKVVSKTAFNDRRNKRIGKR